MKKRNIVILVVLLVIGFASITTTLVINGTIGISTNKAQFDADVVFSSAEPQGKSKGATARIERQGKEIIYTSEVIISIGEEAVLDYKVKNNSKQYDADVTIRCGLDYDKINESTSEETPEVTTDGISEDPDDDTDSVTEEEEEDVGEINYLEYIEITPSEETMYLKLGQEKPGVLKAKMIRSYIGNKTLEIPIKCTLSANAVSTDGTVEPEPEEPTWPENPEPGQALGKVEEKVLVFVDGEDGKTDGDEITIVDEDELEDDYFEDYATDGEHFFVISDNPEEDDKDILTLLAKYNLKVNNGSLGEVQMKQMTSVYPSDDYKFRFATESYWASTWKRIENVDINESGLLLENAEKAIAVPAANRYAQSIDTRLSGRLLTESEVFVYLKYYGMTSNLVAKAGYEDMLRIFRGSYNGSYLNYYLGTGYNTSYPSAFMGNSPSIGFDMSAFDGNSICGIRPVVEMPMELIDLVVIDD